MSLIAVVGLERLAPVAGLDLFGGGVWVLFFKVARVGGGDVGVSVLAGVAVLASAKGRAVLAAAEGSSNGDPGMSSRSSSEARAAKTLPGMYFWSPLDMAWDAEAAEGSKEQLREAKSLGMDIASSIG